MADNATKPNGYGLGDPHLNSLPRTQDEAAQIAAATAMPRDFTSAQTHEEKPAGAATVQVLPDANAFSQPSANMAFEDELAFRHGNGLFRQLWAASSSSPQGGLGPLYNAQSCQQCHIRDGRGRPPDGADDSPLSLVFRLSIPGPDSAAMAGIKGHVATHPDPTYGAQLQDLAVSGHVPEYRQQITYTDKIIAFADGTTATLRHPTYQVTDLGYGPLHPGAMLSPRIAPQMIGLGLLEAIPATDILAYADPEDMDGNGISGRPNIVWSVEYDQPMLGRFGLKAGSPTILQQSASAFAQDIGISNPLFPADAGDCMAIQVKCQAAAQGDGIGDTPITEIDAKGLDLVAFYSRNLGVPARRGVDDPQVLRGKQLFHATGCVACHRPSYVTHRLPDQPDQNFQLIWPYTDMLLHDMGPDLADARPEARATGQEWRTPPLWGIGLTRQVSGHSNFLHDGRARSLLEAILWHGGEAQAQRDAVIAMPTADRDALIAFLQSL